MKKEPIIILLIATLVIGIFWTLHTSTTKISDLSVYDEKLITGENIYVLAEVLSEQPVEIKINNGNMEFNIQDVPKESYTDQFNENYYINPANVYYCEYDVTLSGVQILICTLYVCTP